MAKFKFRQQNTAILPILMTTKFSHYTVVCTSLACAPSILRWRSRSKTQRIEDDGRMSLDVWKTAAQQKDER